MPAFQTSRSRWVVNSVAQSRCGPTRPSAIDELARVFPCEVLPRPLNDGFEFGAYDRQQCQMDAQPGGEGDGADEFMVLLAEFGYGCVAADHGEDATIGVDEGSGGFAADGGEDVPCTLPASLLGDGCELRQGLAIGVGGIGQIADDVDVVEPGDARGRVVPRVFRLVSAVRRVV